MTKRRLRHTRRVESLRHEKAPTGKNNDSVDDRPVSFSVLLSVCCSVALLLRLINVLQTVEMPTVVQLLGDAKGYFDWATRIAGGQWYGTETFYQAPLYPYMLAVLIKAGGGVFGVRLFQAILGTTSVFLLGVSSRHIFGKSVGLLAAAMYAVYPPAIYYDGIIQKTSLASFLLCALLAACTLVPTSQSPLAVDCDRNDPGSLGPDTRKLFALGTRTAVLDVVQRSANASEAGGVGRLLCRRTRRRAVTGGGSQRFVGR